MSKDALIFGASSGIGYSIAKKLKENGHNIYAVSKNKNNIENAAKEIQFAKYFIADISDVKDLNRIKIFFENNDIKVDVLINSVGIIFPKDLDSLSLEEWELGLKINLTTTFMLYKILGKTIFKKNAEKHNYWFNISSSAGIRLNKEWIGYSVSKSALDSLTKIMGYELQKDNILVNAIAPGRTDTNMRHGLFPNEDKRTLISPEEIANLIAGLVEYNIFIYSQIFDMQPRKL